MPSRTDRLISLLQLALKKRCVARGDQLLKAVTSKQAYLAVCSQQMGANRKKKLLDKCSSYQIPCYEISAERMDQVSSRPTSAMAITDQGFARLIEEALMEDQRKN